MPKLGAVYLFNHSDCSHQSLEVVTEKIAIIHSLMCIVPFSLVLPHAGTHCHLLSFFVTRWHSLLLCVTRWHSLTFIVIYITRCYSLSLVVLLGVTRCYSLLLDLSFYKRLIQSVTFATAYSWKIDVHKFEKCKRENLWFKQNLWSSSYLVELFGKNANL